MDYASEEQLLAKEKADLHQRTSNIAKQQQQQKNLTGPSPKNASHPGGLLPVLNPGFLFSLEILRVVE